MSEGMNCDLALAHGLRGSLKTGFMGNFDSNGTWRKTRSGGLRKERGE
jgi:hypothetical protein